MLALGQNPEPLTSGPSTKRLLEILQCQQQLWLSKQTLTGSDRGISKSWLTQLPKEQRDSLLETLKEYFYPSITKEGQNDGQ